MPITGVRSSSSKISRSSARNERLFGLVKDKESSRTNTPIDITTGLSSDQKMAEITAKKLEVPFVDLSKQHLSEEILKLLPHRIVHNHRIIPFAINETSVSLATTEINNHELFSMIEQKLNRKVKVFLALESDMTTIIKRYKKDLQTVIDEVIAKEIGQSLTVTTDLPIIHIIDLLISEAHREKASDIHIEAEEENVLIRFRIDGILHDMVVLEKSLHSSVVTRIKVLANLRIDEHLVAQDGKIRVNVDNETIDVRVSVIPTTEGEKVVLRLLPATFRAFSLRDLGMNERDLGTLTDAVHKSHGMILSTGPTGSGKTTSIYSLIKILNTREVNITTIEDPVEYRIKGVNHIPVNVKTGLTFAAGLRSLLRQDPNVIFVGEIRDGETAGLAINASLTGHLVLSTLHTNDAATALPRLIDLDVEPFLIASTVNVILAQRLVRRICSSCKTTYSVKRSDLRKQIPEKVIGHYFGKKDTIILSKGIGCHECRSTGYSGRVGIFEVLEITDTIRQLIIDRKDSSIIQEAAKKEGMTTLLDDGMTKIASGDTTIDEVLRVLKVEKI